MLQKKIKIISCGDTSLLKSEPKCLVEFYIDKTDKTGRFVAVTVQFKSKFSKPITLESIKKNKDLSHLALIKQSRLSVMPVDYKSWKIINNMSRI